MKELSQEEKIEFFQKIKDKLDGIKGVVKQYGVEQTFAMTFVGGLYSTDDKGVTKLAATADFVVSDSEELDELLDAAEQLYTIMNDDVMEEAREVMPTSLEDTEDWGVDEWMDYLNKKGDNDVN